MVTGFYNSDVIFSLMKGEGETYINNYQSVEPLFASNFTSQISNNYLLKIQVIQFNTSKTRVFARALCII